MQQSVDDRRLLSLDILFIAWNSSLVNDIKACFSGPQSGLMCIA